MSDVGHKLARRCTDARSWLLLALHGALTGEQVMPAREKPAQWRDADEGYATTGAWCRCYTGFVCDAHFWMTIRALLDPGVGVELVGHSVFHIDLVRDGAGAVPARIGGRVMKCPAR